ncbi:hypothetical protein [Phytomonospora endophytica]|uniref:Uncharacterized protein YjbJ (UPF0337 family) n=1 Tax=Phytomonospora endophytica TaxID=714109 RepID=A0A841FL66_9ACTN|nr:hypothetical protein [Phytomonospora endophytica]MBB6036665.1 uncharacterized protein YjbJ (UPF0337 family) [Phytomonospora endophytica]GIG65987.1 hypothetical protein Pen01_22820 [Phytomonospora endophytica]
MREHAGTATASRPARDGRKTPPRPPHALLALQAKAGNRAVAGLVAVQRCGPIPHEQCPCDTDGEPKVQRLADGAGLVSGFAAAPGSFGAGLPELSGSLAELRASDAPEAAERLPTVDQRPGLPAAKTPAAPKPVADPKLGAPRTPAPVSPPATALSGPPPVLELSGEADPGLAHRAGESALGELGAVAGESGREAAADHGENAVGEAAPAVRVSPAPLSVPSATLTAPAIVPPAGDSPTMAQAESSLGGWLTERTGEAASGLRAGESAGRDRIDKAVGDGDARLAKATADTTTRQQALGTGVQQDVAGERATWTTTATAMHAEHTTSTKAKLSALDANVSGIVGEADRGAKREYASAESAAKAQQGTSLLDRAAGALSTLKQAVGGLFDRARQAAKGLYDAAKSRVSGLVGAFADAVRAGAAAVAEKIRAAAARAKAAIAAKVRAAVEAVKKAASDLAALGRKVLDGVGAAVRAGLAVIGRAAQAAMAALRKAAELVKRALSAIADLMRRIAAYEPIPVGLYELAAMFKREGERLAANPRAVTANMGGAAAKGAPDPLNVGPAGSCGVCKGGAMRAGSTAHRIIQAAYITTGGFVEYPIPQRDPTRRDWRVDLARWQPDGSLAIGEIKPGHEAGYESGVKSIAKYLAGIEGIQPGLRLIPLTDLIPDAKYPNPEGGPNCPDQTLKVNPPVGGIYGYRCEPRRERIEQQCECEEKKPPPLPVGKKKESEADEKEKDQAKEAWPGLTPVLAFILVAAILYFVAAALVAIFSPEPISKTAGAVAAIALFVGLAALLAQAKGGGGDTQA